MIVMRIFPVRRRALALCGVAGVLLLEAGCHRKAYPVVAAAPRPLQVAALPDEPPPFIWEGSSTNPPVLSLPMPVPAPPRVRPRPAAGHPPDAEVAAAEPAGPKPEPPSISPRYTPAEEANLREQTNQSLLTAERNLQRMNGRKLTPPQSDLAEKIRGFLAQSREAISAGDWFRAQNLASKAQVLSQELVRSR